MKTIILLAWAVLAVFRIQGQAPTGYYDATSGLYGTALQAALHEIIRNHQVQTYASLYTHFQSTDRKADLSVWDMYSDVPGGTPPYVYFYNSGHECGNYNGEGQCYNREHSWPQSWFGGSILPMHTDLFHIYPTDGFVNNRRANYPYGEVNSPTWTSLNDSKVGQNVTAGYSGVVFEPIDEYKGDLARSFFYMSVRYFGLDGSWPGSPMTNGSQLAPWALDLMIIWHEEDPVSEKEINRNNAVFNIQENRNPFIDHPEFVFNIWDASAAIGENDNQPFVAVYPVPVIDYCSIIFSEPVPTNSQVAVYNMLGMEIAVSYLIEGNKIILNTNSLSRGLYITTIVGQDDVPVLVKILK